MGEPKGGIVLGRLHVLNALPQADLSPPVRWFVCNTAGTTVAKPGHFSGWIPSRGAAQD
jgi:hypothetical protein